MQSAGLPAGRVPSMFRHRSALIVTSIAEIKRVGMRRRYYAGSAPKEAQIAGSIGAGECPTPRSSEVRATLITVHRASLALTGARDASDETRGQVHPNSTEPPPIAMTAPTRSPQR